jgi:hypothetical protein
MRHGSTFGGDYAWVNYPQFWWDPANTMVHETGHLFGLPDLGGANPNDWWENMSPVGAWDPMSVTNGTLPGHFLVWHKWRIGWVSDSNIDCIPLGEFQRDLYTFDTPDRLQAIVIPLGPSTAYVIEARRRIGFDERICQEGVLVYKIDANVQSGKVPIWVQKARPDVVNSCHPANRAPFGPAPGRIPIFQDLSAGLTVEVLREDAKSYRVRVRKASTG